MNTDQTLLEFPCDFTIKIIGSNNDTFFAEITSIIRKYFPDIKDADIKKNSSKENNYLAISATLHAKDKKTLDALYMELTNHPDTRMVL